MNRVIYHGAIMASIEEMEAEAMFRKMTGQDASEPQPEPARECLTLKLYCDGSNYILVDDSSKTYIEYENGDTPVSSLGKATMSSDEFKAAFGAGIQNGTDGDWYYLDDYLLSENHFEYVPGEDCYLFRSTTKYSRMDTLPSITISDRYI